MSQLKREYTVKYSRLLSDDTQYKGGVLRNYAATDRAPAICCRISVALVAWQQGMVVGSAPPHPRGGTARFVQPLICFFAMEVIGKTSKRIRRVIDTEINELMKWAGQQSPQENEFTMSAWIPRHLRGLMKFVNDLRLGEGKSSQNGRRMQVSEHR